MSEDNKNFPFTVDGRSLNSPDEKLTGKGIIEIAKSGGVPAAQGQIDDLVVQGKEGNYSLDDVVDLSRDNEFSLKAKVYKLKVNGQELESNFEKLVALDVLKMAREKGVLPESGDVFLEAVGGPQFENDEWVDLGKFTEFMAIPAEPTPVASCPV